MIYIFALVSTFVMMFGVEGRGSWSKNIASIGGILWIVSLILGFSKYGAKDGLILAAITLVFAAALSKILKPLLNPHNH